MIGVLSGAGRVALSQVARSFGREAMQRIMQGEAIETVLTRDEMRKKNKEDREGGFYRAVTPR